MGYDPTGCWNLRTVLDVAVTIVSAVVSVAVGVCTAISTYCASGSTRKARKIGATAAVATFGTLNNATNAVYYNHISDGKADIETDATKSTYVDSYVNRWDRLDYTKQETNEETYNSNAWRYHSEYSVHMFGWYMTSWAFEQDVPIISSFAQKFHKADVDPKSLDRRWEVKVGTILWGLLGI